MLNKIIKSFTCLVILLIFTNIHYSQDFNAAKNLEIKYGDCQFRITATEFVEEIDGMETDKENSRLMVVELTGTIKAKGTMTLIPTLFNICYTNGDRRPEISPSRAFGFKGKDQHGDYFESWMTAEDNFGDVTYLVFDKSETLIFYIAFDLPNGIDNFDLLIPEFSSNKKI